MGISKDRLAALTDGVIAIAATIMVLELSVPAEATFASLLTQWPVFVAYISSYIVIYLVWLNHHNAFKKVEEVSIRVFAWNGVWLFLLTLVPFFTKWVGERPNDTLPEFLYVLIITVWSVTFQLMDNQIIKDAPNAEADVTNTPKIRIPLYIGCAIALVMSFILPVMSLVLIFVIVIALSVSIFAIIREKK